MKYLFAVVIAIALFGAAHAIGAEYDRACRLSEISPRVKTGFQVPAYLGTWYEVERYEAVNQTELDCVIARYTLNADGSVQVDNSGWTDGGGFIQFIGRAVPAFPEEEPLPAKLSVVFVEGQIPSIYWVISTDYVNYALVWSCSDLPNGRSREQVWVLSRTPQLGATQRARINALVAENALEPDVFRTTGQDFDVCTSPTPL